MNRRERLENKLQKRLDWADGREQDSARRFDTAYRALDGIPPGQPILVGHHSERRHRGALDKHDRNMRAGFESADMAAHHKSKAGGIEAQLADSIFSDDHDAVEAIEARIAELEAEREEKRKIGAAWRKAKKPKAVDVDGWARVAAILAVPADHLSIKRARMDCASEEGFCNRGPVPSYVLSNLGGNISRLRKRLEWVKVRKARTEKAEAAPGGIIIEGTGEYVRVTFAEKPERSVIEALKAAGFGWGGGSWTGQRAKLPEGIEVPSANE